jgi:hypothetical protein
MNQRDIELVNMPIPNLSLLDKVIDRIEAEPEAWDQGSWGDVDVDNGIYQPEQPCGTTACFAGHAVIEASILNTSVVRRDQDSYYPYWDLAWIDPETGKEVPSGRVPELARIALGITEADAEDIFFHIENDLQWFKVKVEELRGRAKEQAAAFDRIAEELIASVPELADVIKPGYLCPESREALIAALLDFRAKD